MGENLTAELLDSIEGGLSSLVAINAPEGYREGVKDALSLVQQYRGAAIQIDAVLNLAMKTRQRTGE